MVGDAASALENLVTSSIFNSLILVDQIFSVHASVVESQVDVDGGTSLINLSNAEGDPNTFFGESLSSCLVIQSLLDFLLKIRDLTPWAGKLERLS